MAYAIAVPALFCLLSLVGIYTAGFLTHVNPAPKSATVAGVLLGFFLFGSNELIDKAMPRNGSDWVILAFFAIPFITQIFFGLTSRRLKR
jgi:hypothetical protein